MITSDQQTVQDASEHLIISTAISIDAFFAVPMDVRVDVSNELLDSDVPPVTQVDANLPRSGRHDSQAQSSRAS